MFSRLLKGVIMCSPNFSFLCIIQLCEFQLAINFSSNMFLTILLFSNFSAVLFRLVQIPPRLPCYEYCKLYAQQLVVDRIHGSRVTFQTIIYKHYIAAHFTVCYAMEAQEPLSSKFMTTESALHSVLLQ